MVEESKCAIMGWNPGGDELAALRKDSCNLFDALSRRLREMLDVAFQVFLYVVLFISLIIGFVFLRKIRFIG